MAMAVGGCRRSPGRYQRNPADRCLLVLLIIFMVITPLTPKGLDALVPQPPKDQEAAAATATTAPWWCRCSKGAGDQPALKINQDDVTWENLQGHLNDIFKTRAEKVMFVKG